MKKITKAFLGIAFIVVLLGSMFVAAPASAGAQSFTYATEPSDSNAICAYGVEIYDVAVATTNPDVIYIATNGETLKSTNQGRTWFEIHTGEDGTVQPEELVAVAGDNADIVVYASNADAPATNDLHVRISVNGGVSFADLGIPKDNAGGNVVLTITDIDVSNAFTDLYGNTYRYVGVTGIGPITGGGGFAHFYYCKFGQYTGFGWKDAVVDNPTGYLTPGNDNDASFVACKFSPAFGADNIVYLLSEDDTGANTVELHVFSLNLGYWDALITGFEKYDLGPTKDGTDICAIAGATVTKAQIVFDPNFCGVYYSPYARTAYCSIATDDAAQGGVFKITENASAIPSAAGLITATSVWSMAVNADGSKWVAAAQSNNTVWRSAVPVALTNLPVKGIGSGIGGWELLGATGNYGKMTINYAGANVVCAKAGNAGAFSLSTDDGYTFNDISLVNTWTSSILDKAVSADGVQRYVVTRDRSYAATIAGNGWDGFTAQTAALAGTITTVIGNAAVVGVGTSFTTELLVGQYITTAGGNTYQVASITDNLNLTLVTAATAAEAGVTFTAHKVFASVFFWDGTYWERVFVRGVADNFIVRASPVSFSTAFLADTNPTIGATYAGYFYYTSTTGKADWRFRQRTGVALADLEVVNDAELYVAINDAAKGYVSALTYSGLYYATAPLIPVFDTIGGNHFAASITLVSGDSVTNESVLAGSRDGYVAYTSTGGQLPSAWGAIPAKVTVANGYTYTAATSCAVGSVVYAVSQVPVVAAAGPPATSAALYSYVIGSMAPAWSVVTYTTVAAAGQTAVSRDVLIYGGCLYYISEDVTNTDLALGRAFVGSAVWGYAPYPAVGTGSVWANTPNVLKASVDASGTPGPQIWFIDDDVAAKYAFAMNSWGLWTAATMFNVIYTDVLAVSSPTLISPVDKYIIQVNDQTGESYDVAFRWSVPILFTPATLQIAADSAFTDIRAAVGPLAAATPVAVVGPNQTAYAPGLNTDWIFWQPGEIFYWRVVIMAGPFMSLPSEVREIDVQAAAYPAPEMLYPANGATINSSTVSFSWSPMSGTATGSAITTTYTVWFGTDPNFAAGSYTSYSVTNTTGMVLNDVADGTYYWRVCTQIAPTTNWGATMTFTVDTTVPETETVIVTTGANAVTVNPDDVTIEQTSPAFIWAIIVIGAVLVIAIIVLIFRTRSK